jgi:hypothetical protein
MPIIAELRGYELELTAIRRDIRRTISRKASR